MPPKETCAFVLDTIQINNPTIIEYDNIRYVINTTNVDSIPQKDIGTYLDSTFHFILGDNIYYDLPDILYNKVISYSNDVDCGYGIKSKRKNYNILYFRFSSDCLNRLKNKLLTEYLKNRGNDLATVRISAFCGAMLSNNS